MTETLHSSSLNTNNGTCLEQVLQLNDDLFRDSFFQYLRYAYTDTGLQRPQRTNLLQCMELLALDWKAIYPRPPVSLPMTLSALKPPFACRLTTGFTASGNDGLKFFMRNLDTVDARTLLTFWKCRRPVRMQADRAQWTHSFRKQMSEQRRGQFASEFLNQDPGHQQIQFLRKK